MRPQTGCPTTATRSPCSAMLRRGRQEERNTMATVNSRALVDQLIANNGHYEKDWEDPMADPPVLRITEYQNAYGGTAYGLCYPQDPIDKYAASAFVIEPQLIFEHVAHPDCNDPKGR